MPRVRATTEPAPSAEPRPPGAPAPAGSPGSPGSRGSASGAPVRSARRHWLLVGAIVLAAVGLRVWNVLAMRANPVHEVPMMDSDFHVAWARAFAAGEEFEPMAGRPFFRAPLYIWMLGSIMKAFGEGLLAPRLLQSLLGGATALLVYLIGARAFDRRVGLVASAFAAGYWVLVYFDGELLLETLAVPLGLFGIWLALGLADDDRPRRAAATGLAWGLAAITRPNALLFMPFLAAWLLWRRRAAPRAGLLAVAALTAGTLAPILPITAWNTFARGDFVLIASQGGVNFWIGNNPQSDGRTAIVPGTRGGWWDGYHDAIALAEEEIRSERRARGDEEGARASIRASEVSQHYFAKGRAFWREQPGKASALVLDKLRTFWSNWEVGNNQDIVFAVERYSPLRHWRWLDFGFLAPLGLVGLVLALRGGARRFPLWGFVPVYTASVVLFFVCERFRLPVLPPLMVFAAHALVTTADLWRRGERGRAGLLGGILAAGVATWSFSGLTPDRSASSESNGLVGLAIAESARGDDALALDHLQEAVRVQPENVVARMTLAKLLDHLGRTDAAVRELEAARQLPIEQIAQVRTNLVELLLQLYTKSGRSADAERLAAEAMRAEPLQWIWPFQLARARIAERRWAEAIAPLERALELDRACFPAAFSLGMVQAQLGELDAAIAGFERAVASYLRGEPQFVDQAFDHLLQLYARRGTPADRAAAAAHARRFLELRPDQPKAREWAERLGVR